MVDVDMSESSNAAGVTTHYIIEHYEEEFSDWTFSEYTNMILTLNKIYDSPKNSEEAPATES